MDRLRRSFRESFRRKKDAAPELSRTQQWQADEAAVRGGTCNFNVKYLGCVEVYESRGMQVCEEALKILKSSRRRAVKGVLQVSGDALRVVENEFKGLIVDQTIEKVSFCAPDRNHERGFSYICRDGTTRRWMCHGFIATKDSGERLSHAVGCAFAVCLERKQKREKELALANTANENTSSNFARTGSFRAAPLTERLQDPQQCKLPVEPPPPVKQVVNPHAIERPHAAPHLLMRQGSFRGFPQLNESSPFKRQLSLRIAELPSNVARQQNSFFIAKPAVAAIPENCTNETNDLKLKSACKEFSEELSNLYSKDDPFLRNNLNNKFAHQSPLPAVPPRTFSQPKDSLETQVSAFSAAAPRNGLNPVDPFDVDWASTAATAASTNPFIQNTSSTVVKTFQAHV